MKLYRVTLSGWSKPIYVAAMEMADVPHILYSNNIFDALLQISYFEELYQEVK